MKNSRDQDAYFEKDPSIVSRRIADELILVPIRQKADDVESIFTMNEVGGRIWELLDGKTSLSKIRDVIVAEFEVEPQEAQSDLLEFIQQLQEAGAIWTV